MASRSPSVVLSHEYRVLLSTKSSISPLYVLINTVAIGGRMVVMVCKTNCLSVECFDASTSSTFLLRAVNEDHPY